MRILINDPDRLDASWTMEKILEHFEMEMMEFIFTPSEQIFLTNLGQFAKCPPDIVISEVILRVSLPPTADVLNTNFTGGFKCHEAFLAAGLSVPWIYFTGLSRSNFDSEGNIFLEKRERNIPELVRLIEANRSR